MNNVNLKNALDRYTKTKIIVSLDLMKIDYDHILKIIEAGADGIRLNFSNSNHNDLLKAIKHIRKASQSLGIPVAVIQDLRGPKICLGDFEGVIPVEKGQNIRLRYGADYSREGIIPTKYDLSKKVKRGEALFFYDGKIKSTIASVKDKVISLTIENNGVLIANKNIKLPDTNFEGDILTSKDKKDIIFGLENDIDYISFGFIQAHTDVLSLRRHLKNLGSTAKVIVRIETKFALADIEKIVECSDAVIVAGRELAIEAEPEAVPIAGRIIIGLGRKYSKPSIIVANMTENTSDSTGPSNVEVGEIATAVIIGADAIMLSDDNGFGKNIITAVNNMKKIISYTEKNSPLTAVYNQEYADAHTKAGAISNAILTLAEGLDVSSIITETKSGATAFNIAGHRPKQPIIAVTSSEKVTRQLALLYGCRPYFRKDEHNQAIKLASYLLDKKLLEKNDIVVIASGVHPGVVGTTDTIKVRVLE